MTVAVDTLEHLQQLTRDPQGMLVNINTELYLPGQDPMLCVSCPGLSKTGSRVILTS